MDPEGAGTGQRTARNRAREMPAPVPVRETRDPRSDPNRNEPDLQIQGSGVPRTGAPMGAGYTFSAMLLAWVNSSR
jgi:hypothetical protein